MVSRNESEAAAGLRDLIHRLGTRRVTNWTDSDVPPLAPMVEGANIVTSRLIDGGPSSGPVRHAVVLDIDHPTWLVKSTTPGHFHLYIDVPGGVPHNIYMNLLNMLLAAGVIEPGYAKASQKRGFTSVRLPWIKKGQN
jgi:hypothetical protein